MSSGGSDTQETEIRLSPEIRSSSLAANQGARNLYNQGTAGIYQGSQLADQNALIRQAQEQQLGLVGQNGDISNTVQMQQDAFRNLLGAGDINNPLMQRQLADLADVVGEQFGRTILPQISQGSTAAGQYGSSRQGIAEGLAAGEAANAISRGATQALLGGQNVALNAQGMAPQSIGLGFLPSDVQSAVGQERTQRSQMELADYIQQFEAPRRAELQNLTQFTQLLQNNPLMAESNQTTTTESSGGGFGQALLGAGAIGADLYSGGAFSGFSGLLGGGGLNPMSALAVSNAGQGGGSVFNAFRGLGN